MIGKLPEDKEAATLVVCSVEMALYYWRLGYLNITVVTVEYSKQVENIVVGLLGYEYITLEELKKSMKKFDVVIGNPPYQHPTHKANKMWPKFIELGKNLVTDSGFMAFITPSSWIGAPNFGEKGLARDAICSMNIVGFNHIPPEFFSVGEKICWYILSHREDIPAIPYDSLLSNKSKLLLKIVGNKYKFVHHSIELYHQTNGGILAYHTYANQFNVDYQENFSKSMCPKVIFNCSGKYHVAAYDKTTIAGKNARSILCETMEEAEHIARIFNLKLCVYAVTHLKTGGFNSAGALPDLDLTKSWTNEELYSHFNLTEDEIAMIEMASVK